MEIVTYGLYEACNKETIVVPSNRVVIAERIDMTSKPGRLVKTQ